MRGSGVRSAVRRVLGVLVLLFGAGLAGADAPAEIQSARLASLQGDVEILSPGATRWRMANARERIRPGARVRTGAGAWAILELSDRNLVRLGARTEIALDAAEVRRSRAPSGALLRRRDAYRFVLTLPHGSLSNILGRLGEGGRYELVTPIATAGVRGTEFGATVEPPPGDVPTEVIEEFGGFCKNVADRIIDGILPPRLGGKMIGERMREIRERYGTGEHHRIRESVLKDLFAASGGEGNRIYLRRDAETYDLYAWGYTEGVSGRDWGDPPPTDPEPKPENERASNLHAPLQSAGGAAGAYRVAFGVTQGEIEVGGGILPDPVAVRQGMSLLLEGTPGRVLHTSPPPAPTPPGTVVGPGAFVGDPNQSQFDAIRSSQGSEGGQHQY